MAAKAKVTPVLNPAVDLSALVAAAVAAAMGQTTAPAVAAPAAASKTVKAPAVAVASNKAQASIDAALTSIGAKVTRFGATEARTTAKCYGRWVDCRIGTVRFQGNIYVSKA